MCLLILPIYLEQPLTQLIFTRQGLHAINQSIFNTMSMNETFQRKYTLDRGRFVEHLSRTQVAQKSATKCAAMVVINLVTPKAAAVR
jgi:hypothetical protein